MGGRSHISRTVQPEDQATRIWAAFGLAERDDPRCVDGARRVGDVEDYDAWSWILRAPSRYEERRKQEKPNVTE